MGLCRQSCVCSSYLPSTLYLHIVSYACHLSSKLPSCKAAPGLNLKCIALKSCLVAARPGGLCSGLFQNKCIACCLQLNTFHVDYTDLFLSRSSCYLKEYTLHYYPYYKANAFNAQALLAESLMREAVRNVTIHVKKAAEYGQTLRISEANSLTSRWRMVICASAALPWIKNRLCSCVCFHQIQMCCGQYFLAQAV